MEKDIELPRFGRGWTKRWLICIHAYCIPLAMSLIVVIKKKGEMVRVEGNVAILS